MEDNSSTPPELSLDDAEILLENKKYLPCTHCETSGTSGPIVICCHCRGWNIMPNPRYVEAAKHAGLPVPEALDTYCSSLRERGLIFDESYVMKLQAEIFK